MRDCARRGATNYSMAMSQTLSLGAEWGLTTHDQLCACMEESGSRVDQNILVIHVHILLSVHTSDHAQPHSPPVVKSSAEFPVKVVGSIAVQSLG